jgi:hypothetical protein
MNVSPIAALVFAGGALGFVVMGLVLVASASKTQSTLSQPMATTALTATSPKPDLAPEPPPKLDEAACGGGSEAHGGLNPALG